NEVAVQRFLEGDLGYLDIPRAIDKAMQAHSKVARPGVEDLVEADRWARQFASTLRPVAPA
ncbi:MAG: 1-deoxy-D-xylulose-5-phosphate reductoisomerase, partial [Candidatus Eremiobacterota bacterium]